MFFPLKEFFLHDKNEELKTLVEITLAEFLTRPNNDPFLLKNQLIFNKQSSISALMTLSEFENIVALGNSQGKTYFWGYQKSILLPLIALNTIFIHFNVKEPLQMPSNIGNHLKFLNYNCQLDVIFYVLHHLFSLEQLLPKDRTQNLDVVSLEKGKQLVFGFRKKVFDYFLKNNILPDSLENQLYILMANYAHYKFKSAKDAQKDYNLYAETISAYFKNNFFEKELLNILNYSKRFLIDYSEKYLEHIDCKISYGFIDLISSMNVSRIFLIDSIYKMKNNKK